MIHTLVDGICLVTVGNDGFIAKNTYRSVDDKTRVSELGRIKCLGADAFSVLYKDAVAAVGTAAHNKISSHSMCAVRGAANDDSTSGICVGFQFLFQG